MGERILTESLHGGAVLHLLLNAPPGNILDIAMITELARTLAERGNDPHLKAVMIEGCGPHFSYGASVQEHRPDRVAEMLGTFHALFRQLAGLDRMLVAVVRGRCLGGGMELACFCHRVFVSPDARLGQPEIHLGVFPPVASLILPRRAGQATADDLCLTGRTVDARQAVAARIVDEVADDPRAAADAWIEEHVLPKSAAALKHAVCAVRHAWNREFFTDLADVERLYLDDLMRTEDAVEGIEAFIAKRPPKWKDR